MSNKKRVTIRCWSCQRTYTLLRDFDRKDTLSVACPYCHKTAIVNLGPYERTDEIIIAGEVAPPFTLATLNLPDILPSEPVPDAKEE